MVLVLGLLCAAAALLAWLVLPGESDAEQRAPFWGANIAHRGLFSEDQTTPENSLAAFTAAVDAGYAIELDVRLSKDGEVVVFHDDTLQRACGVDERVDALTLEQLQQLRLFGSAQTIPTLQQVLQLVNQQVPLLIELKKSPNYRLICENTWRILRLYDGDIAVESFDPRILRMFKKYVPGLLRGQLSARPQVLGAGLPGVLVGWGLANFVGRPHFLACHKGGRTPLLWLAARLCMRMVYTAGPEDDAELLQSENDAVIFQHYLPVPYYLDDPQEPPRNPAEEDYRF